MWPALSQFLRDDGRLSIEIYATLADVDPEIIRDLPYFNSASRSQVFGAEDDATMTQYEMPMEEQIKLLVKKVSSLDEKFDALDEKFDGIDKKFDGIDKKFDAIDKKFDAIDKKFDAMDKKFDAVDKKFDAVDKKFDAMDQKLDTKFGEVMVRLDSTHAIAKLGLEGLQGLRESMDDKFAAAAKKSAEQTDQLKSVLVHVRKRVDVLERPKPRRRRS